MIELKPKILVVDDELLFIQLMDETLKDEFEIIYAYNSDEALEMASEEKPDLILLDVVMAPMNGFDVCQTLKSEPSTRDIPVLFITSSATMKDEIHGLELGAVDYIGKPVNPPVVKARVRNHVELKQYKDKLERIAAEDMLTGLATRRRFEQTLQSEWRRCWRQSTPLSITMMDIDFFKKFNDTYGHSDGDDCLRAVGGALVRQIKRPADLVARYGGEEFVCVMPDTNLDGALALAHSMRSAIEDLKIEHAKSDVASHVTMSIGVSTCIPSEKIDPFNLLKAADENLYKAKHNGRNRVEGGSYESDSQ